MEKTLPIKKHGSSKPGSPPHTWRKRINHQEDSTLRRITSTYVEKTQQNIGFLPSVEDHLHIRGENRDALAQGNKGVGSPPHTWRKLGDDDKGTSYLRITSTYVEKTNSSGKCLNHSQDHLHIRGENT